MNTKIILSTVAGTVVLFLLGGLIYGFALADFMAAEMEAGKSCLNEPMPMTLIICANIVFALLLSLLLDRLGVRTLKSGAITAAWIGLLIALWFDCWMLATFNFMTGTVVIVDVIANTVLAAAAGAVIGWILGR